MNDSLLFSRDLWQYLQEESRDILLYGMGNGADKLLAVCEQKGVSVKGIFASDGFVRGHSFHGMRVMSYSEVESIYPPNGCVVLLAFGSSRPEVMALFDRVAARYPLFVPDLPVCGENLFDAAFMKEHHDRFVKAQALFCDERSRALFTLILHCKHEGVYALLGAATSEKQAFDLLPTERITAMADLQTVTDVVTLPADALVEEGTKTLVYTGYDEENEKLVNPVEVTVGVSDGETVQILDGLEAGTVCWYAYYDTLQISVTPDFRSGGNLFFGG